MSVFFYSFSPTISLRAYARSVSPEGTVSPEGVVSPEGAVSPEVAVSPPAAGGGMLSALDGPEKKIRSVSCDDDDAAAASVG